MLFYKNRLRPSTADIGLNLFPKNNKKDFFYTTMNSIDWVWGGGQIYVCFIYPNTENIYYKVGPRTHYVILHYITNNIAL